MYNINDNMMSNMRIRANKELEIFLTHLLGS